MASSSIQFELFLKSSSAPSFVISEEGRIIATNLKFRSLLDDTTLFSLSQKLGPINHLVIPHYFGLKVKNSHFVCFLLPLMDAEKLDFKLGFVISTQNHVPNNVIELGKEAFHEINNPLTIIYTELLLSQKREVLTQVQLDRLLERLEVNFQRIEDFISKTVR